MSLVLLHGGRILTMVPGEEPAEALLIDDGRVVAAGPRSELERSGVESLDLDGATALPGLIDTHPHLMHFAVIAAPMADLSDASSWADIERRIAAKVAETPEGEWVMATPVGEAHYFGRRSFADLAEGELPPREVLDRAAPAHPVIIHAWAPRTPNVCAFNSLGLERAGIEPPYDFGTATVELDPDGRPTGRVHGSVTNYYNPEPAWRDVLLKLPLLQPEHIVPATLQCMRDYNALGVTTVYEGHAMDFPLIEAWRYLASEGQLTTRVLCCPEAELYGQPWDQPLSDAEFDERLEQALGLVERSDERFRIDGVTISRGGPCWPGFVLMREPYLGPYGGETTGVSFVSRERAARAIEFCRERGLRLNIVSAGTAEHDHYLDDVEAAGPPPGWLLQHGYFVEEEQARRYAACGFDVTTSMSFWWGKREMVAERIGPDALADFIPLRRLLDAGMEVGCGSDWGPKNVFEHLALAAGREGDQRVSRHEALDMWTRGAAGTLRWEGIGTLAPGNHADVTIVDRDPLDCPLEDLAETRVLRTLLDGESVFAAGELGV